MHDESMTLRTEHEGRCTSLFLRRPGELAFDLVERSVGAPGPGQVEIGVAAAALNFPDVLTALGVLDDYFEKAPEPGLDCAGVVTRTGRGVTDPAPGDRVAAFTEGAFSSVVHVPVTSVLRVPGRISLEQAAGLPVAYLTAWYGLHRLARVQRGERVLVHSAAGGVGLAAVAVARLLGATVLATAGTPEKHAHLRELGIDHVMDSRSMAFVEETLAATDGEGVDVVLNSLAGPAQQAGLELLRPFGRFVEIGKRDIMAGNPIGLAPFRRNLSLHSVDLLLLGRTRPGLVASMLDELGPLLASGELGPLPYTAYPVGQAADAFRRMAGGLHTGKLVLTFPQLCEDA
ncbi:zinc-binding dehydrogenase [Streptomyces sp. NPDC052036]|uniref:zinc-binding dehydrogenase n=1 Tax=Streptomyces sp. NPDC052036 TaxID=3155171 RepID=UPI003446D3F7